MHYTIELKAIDVGGEFVQMHYMFQPSKRHSAIIDSGTTLAYFPQDVYAQIMRMVMEILTF